MPRQHQKLGPTSSATRRRRFGGASARARPPPRRCSNDHERVWHAVGARAYGSAAELSAATSPPPPEEASRRLADARVRADDGCLLLTTQRHWRRQRTAGLLHCTLCGAFCAGERGLRDHQQVKHREGYGAAKAAVAAATGALIPYAPPASVAGRLSELWADVLAPPRARAARCRPPSQRRARRRFGGAAVVRRRDCGRPPRLERADVGGGRRPPCGVRTARRRRAAAGRRHAARRPHAAALGRRNGHLDVARWLVARGLDANARTRDGTTALHGGSVEGTSPSPKARRWRGRRPPRTRLVRMQCDAMGGCSPTAAPTPFRCVRGSATAASTSPSSTTTATPRCTRRRSKAGAMFASGCSPKTAAAGRASPRRRRRRQRSGAHGEVGGLRRAVGMARRRGGARRSPIRNRVGQNWSRN